MTGRTSHGRGAPALRWEPHDGSGWRGSRPRSAAGTVGSLDARQRFRTM